MMLCESSSNTTNDPLIRRCVFQAETLNSDTFALPPPESGARKLARWILQSTRRGRDPWENPFSGKVNCSLSFTSTDGKAYLAVGCDEGVWIGYYHDPQSLRRVLYLKMVTQCVMLEEFGILLVLANKTLLAYDIEFLLPSSRREDQLHLIDKLGESNGVQFFSIGSLAGRMLVIYMIKHGSKSVLHVLEPTVGKLKVEGPLSSRRFFGRPRWFRTYRDFALPSEAYNVVFLGARIVILRKKGFEIMDLSEFQSITMPQLDDSRPDLKKLAKRCRSCRPMGIFRSSKEEFLLCYNKFGLYVNRSGEPDFKKGTIEWEGTAEHVAWHPPYMLIFNSCFIEVRHIDAGRLCQIIRGNDIGCTCQWDRCTGSSLPSPLPGPDQDEPWGEGAAQRTPVCGVMRYDDESQKLGPSTNVAQRIFELVPTLLDEEILPPTKTDHLCVKSGRTILNPEYDFTLPVKKLTPVIFNTAMAIIPM